MIKYDCLFNCFVSPKNGYIFCVMNNFIAACDPKKCLIGLCENKVSWYIHLDHRTFSFDFKLRLHVRFLLAFSVLHCILEALIPVQLTHKMFREPI